MPRSSRLRRTVATALFAVVAAPSLALAQEGAVPRSGARLAAFADSIAATGDTARALAMLDSAVRRDKRDASAWHQFGLLNWNMARAGRDPELVRDPKVVRWLIVADSALRLATQFAPDSARFWLSLTRFSQQSGVATLLYASGRQAGQAAGAAARSGDTLMLAEAADVHGMAVWRRYEVIANRALNPMGSGVDLSSIQRKDAADYLRSVAGKIKPPTGDKDYLEALDDFRIAERNNRTSTKHARHLFMALGEREQWDEMRSIARGRVALYPLDYQSWLAIGLASHRLNDDRTAQVAFDSATALMDEDERARLTNLSRILRPAPLKNGRKQQDPRTIGGDVRSYEAMEEGARRGLEAMYWMMSDPLALTGENEHRLEFLSRVVWADFRFSNEERNIRGSDTDRGDIYIRYGPPDEQMTVGASGNVNIANNTAQGVTLAWLYPRNLVFFFDLTPGFATARTFFQDQDWVNQVKAAVPVSFANLPVTKLMDTIPVRITRFRAGVDSSDAVIAAAVPVDSLVKGLPMARVPLDVDFRVVDQFVRIRGVESEQTGVAPDTVLGALHRNWTRRLGPGINVVRVEALQLDSRRAARAMSRLDPEPGVGFGMSDVMLGSRPSLRAGRAMPSRWRDIEITPNAGVYAQGSPIGLLWEIYELQSRSNESKYRVAVSVQRTDRSPLGGFAARLLDGVGRAVGRAQTRRDDITYTFDRTGGGGTAVEFLSLDLAEAASGQYRLRVDVTDLISGRRASRTSEFRIR